MSIAIAPRSNNTALRTRETWKEMVGCLNGGGYAVVSTSLREQIEYLLNYSPNHPSHLIEHADVL